MGKELSLTPDLSNRWQTLNEQSSVSHGIFDRDEHTVTGAAAGIVRDIFAPPATTEARKERAQQNDECAKIAADVIASVPRFRAVSAGLVRGAMLIDPTASLQDNASSFALNSVEGAVLNTVVRETSADGIVGKWATNKLGGGLKAEIGTHLLAGAGFSAVRTGFDTKTWHDQNGDLSLSAGATNFVTGTLAGSLINVPAGMAGLRIARLAGSAVSDGLISRFAVGTTSGASAGGVYGFTDSFVQTGSFIEAGKGFLQGSIVGAFTGGLASGVPGGARHVESSARIPNHGDTPVLAPTVGNTEAMPGHVQAAAKELGAKTLADTVPQSTVEQANPPALRDADRASAKPVTEVERTEPAPEAKPKEIKLLERFSSDPERPTLGDDAYDASSIRERIEKFGDAMTFNNSDVVVSEVAKQMPTPERGTYTRTFLADGAPEKFATNEEFDKWIRTDENAPAVIYNVDGIKITVPEADLPQLEGWRKLRIGAEPYSEPPNPTKPPADASLTEHKEYIAALERQIAQIKDARQHRIQSLEGLMALPKDQRYRALPEDFVHALRRTSDRSYIKTITISNEDDIKTLRRRLVQETDEEWKGRVTGAQMHPYGDATFFKPTWIELEQYMKHEQVHRVQNRYGYDLYELARKLDGKLEASEYAHMHPRGSETSARESDAELESKAFLGHKLETFFEATDRAPARMSVIANRLEDILRQASPENRSVDAPQIQARIDYVNRFAKPGVVSHLVDLAESGKKYDTIPLLAHLATEPNPRVEALMLDAVENGDFKSRDPAAVALGRIGDQSTIPKLRRILEESPNSQSKIISAMVKLHSQDEVERQNYLATLASEDTDFRSVANAKFWLRKYADTPAALKLLDNPPGVENADPLTTIRYNLRPDPARKSDDYDPDTEQARWAKDKREMAAYLMGRYGEKSDMAILRQTAVDDPYGAGEKALESMTLLHSDDAREQFDFLLELAKPGSDLQKLSLNEIKDGRRDNPWERGVWVNDDRFPAVNDIINYMANPDYSSPERVGKALANVPDSDKSFWLSQVMERIDNGRFEPTEEKLERKQAIATVLMDEAPQLRDQVTPLVEKQPPDRETIPYGEDLFN